MESDICEVGRNFNQNMGKISRPPPPRLMTLRRSCQTTTKVNVLASPPPQIGLDPCLAEIAILFPDIPRKMGESEGLSKDVIIIIAVVVPLAVFLLILCGLHHRRMSKKASLHSIHYENEKGDKAVSKDRLSNVVSMRDRIQEWKVAPSELTELVDICKSRGVLDIPVDNIGKVYYIRNIILKTFVASCFCQILNFKMDLLFEVRFAQKSFYHDSDSVNCLNIVT